MTCPCPKCAAPVAIDSSRITEDCASSTCPGCKARFWTVKESFARRALKKEGEIYCSGCGHHLGRQVVCSECGLLYPDYCVVQASKPVKQQERKTGLMGLTLKPGKQVYLPTGSENYAQSTSKARISSKYLAIGAALVVVVALVAAGTGFYLQRTAQQEYSGSFFRALYGVKSGVDLSMNNCAAISADSKARMDNVVRARVEDVTKAGTVKAEIDRAMLKIAKPRKNFTQPYQKLAKMHEIYGRMYQLSVEPSGSPTAFADAVANLDTQFKQASQEFKTSIPAELTEEFAKATAKYTNLKNL